jgi:hypothetical protein
MIHQKRKNRTLQCFRQFAHNWVLMKYLMAFNLRWGSIAEAFALAWPACFGDDDLFPFPAIAAW